MNARLPLIAAIVAELAVAAGAAHAQVADAAPTKVVRYDDLNIRSEQGRKALDRRMQVAAREVCSGADNMPTDLSTMMAQAQCIRHALIGARADLGARMTTQIASR